MTTITGAMSTPMTITTSPGPKRRKPLILIAGLGNYLLQDDGVGVHAVRALQQTPLPGVIVADVGTAVLDALHLLEWAEKILAIDAMQAGGAPGTIYAFGVEDVAGPGLQASLHELNLLAALRFLPRPARPEILIVGVEPESIDYGLDLSPAVAKALPELTREVRKIVSDWRRNGLRSAEPRS
jgi:hydrogenase maturation protease